MTRLIALNGSMGVGKSEAFHHISAASLRQVVQVKFAQPIYDIQEFIYSRISQVYKRNANFIKDRKLLQWIGTDWGRALDENLWVNIWKAEVTARQKDGFMVVCDDCRFNNEAEIVKSMGGVIIKIVRPNSGEHAGGGKGILGHASEAGIDDKHVDHTITNDGTLEQYQASLSALLKQLGVSA